MTTNNYLQSFVFNNCLNLILDYLKDKKEILFSCLLVNRLFCQHVIPYLWSSPFDLETNPDKHKLILRTYISCLCEEEQQQLINFQIEHEILSTPRDYPKYLKKFSNQHIQDAVEKFTSTEGKVEQTDMTNTKHKISKLLCKFMTNLLINRTKGFTYVEIIRNSSDLNLVDIDYTIFPRLSQALSRLEVFEFSGVFSQEIFQLFKDFAQHLNTIENLSILLQPQDEALEISRAIAKLIRSQTKLTSFTITQYWDNDISSEIYSAINSQSNYLNYLRIEGLSDVQQLLTVLQNCNNLETLQLWELGEIDNDSLFHLRYPGFRIESIKYLYCDGYYPNNSTLTTVELFLRICSQNLRMLWLGHVTKEIFQDIGEYFPNLNYLSLKIYEEELLDLTKFLSSMPLENLMLSIIPNLRDNNLFNINNTALGFTTSSIMKLVKAIPITLRYFGIDFIMNRQDFKFFFDNLRVPLNQLAILAILENLNHDYMLMAVIDYAKRVESLKELIYDQSYDHINFSEEMLEKARTVIPKISVIKRGKLSIYKNYFDIQYYDVS
ncbi:hypothetical protein GLOIN_2v1686777 [Rhizophagus clarus]|uniref:F-box domain-containing protein n=1 Tax=Rhizophagus clarus TaxID=94130 RepID=A0A8H3M0U3_9GLOM|nr:hypothetical protein GLOIN_2v1686777 [Rhizophagus clarus]